jgi:hydrogenase maturation protease
MPFPVLVLGMGNLLMGDEGVGIHAIRLLEKETLPPDTTVLDGGTGGFHLLSYLQEYPRVVMIDACMDGKAPGTLSFLRPRFASDFPKALSAHDIGLRDLIESVVLLGSMPEIQLITVSIESIQTMNMRLSPPVEAALPTIVANTLDILSEWFAATG